MQKLKGQVTSLKASRDKLLAEVDRQSKEIERLLTHNATLEQVNISPPVSLPLTDQSVIMLCCDKEIQLVLLPVSSGCCMLLACTMTLAATSLQVNMLYMCCLQC